MAEDEILFERRGALAVCTLNRPNALNALSLAMCQALSVRLADWANDGTIKAVLIKGVGERAFCAGGDVRALRRMLLAEGAERACRFYRIEYPMNALIHQYPKPYIALLDGITMGGGAGISIHGSFRVVTERTRFAMPETAIGLFPDVGASYVLARLPGRSGLYLGLTGSEIGAGDCLWTGIGTHAAVSADLAALEAALERAPLAGDPFGAVARVLDDFRVASPTAPLAERQDTIEACFAMPSLLEVVGALQTHESSWANELALLLRRRSPTSLALTYRLYHQARGLDFRSIMRLEYRLVRRCMEGHDLLEGIRAVLVDKDNRPRWCPDRLEDVRPEVIDRYFAPLSEGDLALP